LELLLNAFQVGGRDLHGGKDVSGAGANSETKERAAFAFDKQLCGAVKGFSYVCARGSGKRVPCKGFELGEVHVLFLMVWVASAGKVAGSGCGVKRYFYK
jgi:hypothetical protein